MQTDLKKNWTLSKWLLLAAIIIFLCSIAAFAGNLLNKPEGLGDRSMFAYVFGLGPKLSPIRLDKIRNVFILQMIISAICIFAIVDYIIYGRIRLASGIALAVACVLSIIALSTSFNSVTIFCNAYKSSELRAEMHLSVGPIVYSTSHLVAISLCIGALVLNRFFGK